LFVFRGLIREAIMLTLEGHLVSHPDAQIAIIVSRFNELIGKSLLDGAVDVLLRHGVSDDNITLVRVPGAFEIPLAAQELAKTGKYKAVICLGAVIRGATTHYDFVAGQTASGIAQASLNSGVPIIFGVLTTENIEQALERAGTKAGNKGADAAIAAIEMIDLLTKISV
jgi:6,7-dimethyl-8-ribityllumazine synthase